MSFSRFWEERKPKFLFDVIRNGSLVFFGLSVVASGSAAEEHGILFKKQRAIAFREIVSPACDSYCDSFCDPLNELDAAMVQDLEVLPKKEEINPYAWWTSNIHNAMRPDCSQLPLTLESALIRCVANSTQIKVFSDLPLIRRTAILEAESAFDWTRFADSKWDDTSDPVGSLLTGATGRYENQQLHNSIGLRKRTQVGGVMEAGQSMGLHETNSTFFQPNPQATTKLKFSYTQSLLRGRGVTYNKSLVCLAQFDTKLAESEFSRQIQGHLTEVARGYWALYVARARFFIRQKSHGRAKDIIKQLEDRQQMDAVKPQILRAQAELAVMEAALSRDEMLVRTSEAKLRSLINDPEMGTYANMEIVPIDTPNTNERVIDLENVLHTACELRPEVKQSVLQIRAACLRLNMSKAEVLPVLNLVTETYVAGLASDSNVDDAWSKQFSDGRPSYAFGTQFEMPVARRASKAQQERRVVELRQLRNQYATTLHTLGLEVGSAVREVKANWAEFQARQLALDANRVQLESAIERWKLLAVDSGSAALALESMLRDIDRLTRAETAYLDSWVGYNMSQFTINRVTGELLAIENVSWNDYLHDCGHASVRTVHKTQSGLAR